MWFINCVSLLRQLDYRQPQENDEVFTHPLQYQDNSESVMKALKRLTDLLLYVIPSNFPSYSVLPILRLFLIIGKGARRVENCSEKMFSSCFRNSAVSFGTKWGTGCSHAPGRNTLSKAQMAECTRASVPCVQVCCEYLLSSLPQHFLIIVIPESQFLQKCVEYIAWVVC